MRGPPLDEQLQTYKTLIAAQSISTYPKDMNTGTRQGDPICDQYAILKFHNRTIFALADGCNWGPGPRTAARYACDTFVRLMTTYQFEIQDAYDTPGLILRCFEEAHQKIIEGRTQENLFQGLVVVSVDYFLKFFLFLKIAGTTTMIAGLVLQLTDEHHILVCASIGDCKLFLQKRSGPEAGKIFDVTASNRGNLSDASDCGGRIGPQLSDGSPDLRNLSIFWTRTIEGDIIIGTSDGVYDNLDPTSLGYQPSELGLSYPDIEDDWIAVEEFTTSKIQLSTRVSKARNEFTVDLFEKILTNQGKIEKTAKILTPSWIIKTVLPYCLNLTQSSRDYMENTNGKLPKDYKKYPGKMDHTTMIAFYVGNSSAPTKPQKKSNSASSSHDFSRRNSLGSHRSHNIVISKE